MQPQNLREWQQGPYCNPKLSPSEVKIEEYEEGLTFFQIYILNISLHQLSSIHSMSRKIQFSPKQTFSIWKSEDNENTHIY